MKTKKITLSSIALILSMSVLAACAKSPAVTSTSNSVSPANSGGVEATMPAVSSNIIDISGFAFSPSTLTVKAGTTVTWTNKDTVEHTITSDTNVFDSGSISSGETFSYTFNTAGTFPYHCTVHPSMVGTIIVTQ